MLTETEYKRLRKLADDYMEWVGGRTSYKSDELPENLRELTNEMRSQIEIYEWHNDIPDEYLAYVRNESLEIITWMGDSLGNFSHTGMHYENVERTFFDADDEEYTEYEHQEVRDIYVYGSNGASYIGKYYYQNGDYCRLERVDENE